MTLYIRTNSDGAIEVTGISVAGIQLIFPAARQLDAEEVVKLSQAEGVYFNTREVF